MLTYTVTKYMSFCLQSPVVERKQNQTYNLFSRKIMFELTI